MKITPINSIKLAWPDWISKGTQSNDPTRTNRTNWNPLKKTMEPTNTMEAQHEAGSVINRTEEEIEAAARTAEGYACDQCGETGFKNALGLSMHKARLRGDAKHPAEGSRPRPPSMDPLVRREYARKRYLRVKRERERQKSLAIASASVATEARPRRQPQPEIEVGEIQEHPHVCPRCKLDLDAVAAAMNLIR